MSVTIRELSPVLGAEALGVDASGPIDTPSFNALKSALLNRRVLLLRDQQLSTESQIAFAKRFGNLQEVRSKKEDPNQQQLVMYVANRRTDGMEGALPDGEMFFHSDQCYYERPSSLTMLYAMTLPSKGGETLFSDMGKVWKAMPEDLRRRCRNRTALNMYDYAANPYTRNTNINPNAPQFVHPMVTRHPETGEEILYVNRLMTVRIEGLPPGESDALLAQLFGWAERPEFIYEHRWSVGDLLIWDNRTVLHARKDFDPAEARILRRVTIEGTRPAPVAEAA